MIISVVNHASTQVEDEELQHVLRALNRQIEGDFAPYWSLAATLRLEGRSGKQPSKQALADMRGDAVLYLWDRVDVDDALGYHDTNNRGIPFGFVFTEISRQMGEHWSVTLSHEALELIGDPEVNLLVMGPHPKEPGRNDFLGRDPRGTTLRSFGINPGGYVGFYDPERQDMETVDADEEAARRRQIKSRGQGARRGTRYGRFHTTREALGRAASAGHGP